LPQVAGQVSDVRPVTLPTQIPRGTETILLVEDDESVRPLVVRILSRCGYEVLEAGNGADAIQLVASRSGPVNLLVSDVVMPGMGGRELAGRILAQHPECKVLFISGYTDDAVIRHGMVAAEFAFLQKPFTASSVARKVRSILDSLSQASD
jgi:CheY-like chemotaxis protein